MKSGNREIAAQGDESDGICVEQHRAVMSRPRFKYERARCAKRRKISTRRKEMPGRMIDCRLAICGCRRLSAADYPDASGGGGGSGGNGGVTKCRRATAVAVVRYLLVITARADCYFHALGKTNKELAEQLAKSKLLLARAKNYRLHGIYLQKVNNIPGKGQNTRFLDFCVYIFLINNKYLKRV